MLHWAIAISLTLMILTIFLRMTWLNKENIAGTIGIFLNEKSMTLSQDQLIVLAKKIRQPMWQWHIYTGYVLVGLFSIRFILPFFGIMRIQNPLDKFLRTKEKFQKWLYIVFYVFIVISLLTGLLIEFGPKDLKKPLENIHVLSIYYLIPYVFIHIIGVLVAEFSDQKGIISRIVSGK